MNVLDRLVNAQAFLRLERAASTFGGYFQFSQRFVTADNAGHAVMGQNLGEIGSSSFNKNKATIIVTPNGDAD